MPEDTLQNVSTTLAGLNDSLTQLAQNAGVSDPEVVASIDADSIDAPRGRTPETPARSSQQLIQDIATVPSAVADDTVLTDEEDELRNLIRQQSGEAETRADLERRLQVPELEREIRDISSDISRRRASLTKGLVDQEGRPIAQPFITGRQAQMTRLAAAEIEGLQAAQEAALGNLTTAQSSVERALSAKFDPIREDIQIQRDLIELRKGSMTRKEKRLAENRESQLATLENQIVQSQEREKTSLNQINEAIINGMPPQKASALSTAVINGTADLGDVLSEVGGYIGYYDRVYKQLQIQNIQSQISQRSAETTEGKPLTSAQYKALGFADRMLESDVVIDEIGGEFVGTGSMVGEWLPNTLKSSERQKFEQAKRNFINAILRRESGAAIAPEEFENADRQYFPQPGDSPEVLIQKAQNRATSISGILREAGQDTTLQDSVISDPLQIGVTSDNVNPLGI